MRTVYYKQVYNKCRSWWPFIGFALFTLKTVCSYKAKGKISEKNYFWNHSMDFEVSLKLKLCLIELILVYNRIFVFVWLKETWENCCGYVSLVRDNGMWPQSNHMHCVHCIRRFLEYIQSTDEFNIHFSLSMQYSNVRGFADDLCTNESMLWPRHWRTYPSEYIIWIWNFKDYFEPFFRDFNFWI